VLPETCFVVRLTLFSRPQISFILKGAPIPEAHDGGAYAAEEDRARPVYARLLGQQEERQSVAATPISLTALYAQLYPAVVRDLPLVF
jgi:hypothetical protein